MSESIFIFGVGPVQDFIAEARRVGDLEAGSEVLKRISRAAGQSIRDAGGTLIYPANLTGDVPNRLVARVSTDDVSDLARAAHRAVEHAWRACTDNARRFLASHGPAPDPVWNKIWERQASTLWETYWASAELTDSYRSAYTAARRAFDATKRTRVFPQVDEKGPKDSLSGRRSALRTEGLSPWAYSAQLAASPDVSQAELQAGGRERLDALGAVKRWGGLTEGSPSVSHIAAADFLAAARKEREALEMYRRTIEDLLGSRRHTVSTDPLWPYDGDLFFDETLAAERLETSYGLADPHEGYLEAARQTLGVLQGEVGSVPSPYFATLVFDGDGVGEMVSACRTEQEHRDFSQALLDFGERARQSVLASSGHPVYVGGDDVLALVPLAQALPLAQTLAQRFSHTIEGGTASVGLAIAHHLHPLDATLRAARAAERRAKDVPGKNAVCVRTIRRSGEEVDIRSHWWGLEDTFDHFVALFRSGGLSSQFVYALAEAAYGLPDPNQAFEAEAERLLARHADPAKAPDKAEVSAGRLRGWAESLPASASRAVEGIPRGVSQTEELARWLALARFLAGGGAE